MDASEDQNMLEQSMNGNVDVKLPKKRKRKPKNKYKELNLQQKKAAGIIASDDVLSISKDCKGQLVAAKVKSDNKQSETQLEVGKRDKTRNKKRKLSEVQELENKESLKRKKQKLSNRKCDTDSTKKENHSKLSKALVELKSQSEHTHLGNKFNCKQLKMALEKNTNAEKSLETDLNETQRLPVTKKPKESPVKAKSLRDRVIEKLASARFRYINENLYNMSSHEAMNMFKEDEEAFKVYHKGYSAQVEKWPVNPVDIMIKYIDSKEGNLVVADFGCGEAKIAQSVKGKRIHSFDLVALNEHVTVCDISKVPLANKSVDIAVFCLSLMGTNFVNYLCEASRVLKDNGILLVAEVLSRFEKVGEFVRKMNKLGFPVIKRDESNKMFVWFEFQKAKRPPNRDRLPKIELAACVYKKR